VEFPVIILTPDAAAFALIRLPYRAVVGLLGFLRIELLPGITYSLDPPVLLSSGYCFHVIVELRAEYMIEIRLAKLSAVD
jgi:hypothetical protein